MKILVENISIYGYSTQKRFIDKGYLYIDKGVVVAAGEGVPPPELEIADYIIDGRYSVALPGFVVGIGNIIDYIFRFKTLIERKKDILSTLSLSDIQALSLVTLASIASNGATSVITSVNPADPRVLTGLALAASECWVRLRMVIPVDSMSPQEVEDTIKNVLRGVKDPEAINKKIVSFGFYARKRIDRKFIEIASALDIKIYVDGHLLADELAKEGASDVIVFTDSSIDETVKTRKAVSTKPNMWRPGMGLVSLDPLDLVPRNFIASMSRVIADPRAILDIMCHLNPANLDIGAKSIESGNIADIIILDYSKPPSGPIPVTEDNVIEEIATGNYTVETSLVGGEITLDQGLTLNVGEKHFRKARAVLDSLKQ
uniref:Amidohydrolase-related domain-containing protein n=1 Tax=Ignisphaera aggregans TaxID=334771 RepID=A0A7C2VM15_9CREN